MSSSEAETLGRSLREIRADYVRSDEGEVVRWYQGTRGTDLFAWIGEGGRPTRVQLTFAKSVVEWEPASGLRTGRMDGTQLGSGPGRFDTYLIRADDLAQRQVLEEACALLEASDVDPALSWPVIAALHGALSPTGPGGA